MKCARLAGKLSDYTKARGVGWREWRGGRAIRAATPENPQGSPPPNSGKRSMAAGQCRRRDAAHRRWRARGSGQGAAGATGSGRRHGWRGEGARVLPTEAAPGPRRRPFADAKRTARLARCLSLNHPNRKNKQKKGDSPSPQVLFRQLHSDQQPPRPATDRGGPAARRRPMSPPGGMPRLKQSPFRAMQIVVFAGYAPRERARIRRWRKTRRQSRPHCTPHDEVDSGRRSVSA